MRAAPVPIALPPPQPVEGREEREEAVRGRMDGTRMSNGKIALMIVSDRFEDWECLQGKRRRRNVLARVEEQTGNPGHGVQ